MISGAETKPARPVYETFAALCEANDVDPDLGTLALELTSLEPSLEEGPRTALTLLVLSSLISLREGSTRLPLTADAFESLGEGLIKDQPADVLARALEALNTATLIAGPPGSYRPLIIEDQWVYHHRTHAYEERFVTAVLKLMKVTPRFTVDQAEPAIVSEGAGFSLTDEQSRAVMHALTHPLAVITGGPGTGKTSIVVAILAALTGLGVELERVAIAAPTGKAANRIKDSVANPEPTTLHRLLGYSPSASRFRYRKDNPLPFDFVIVDEASMVDLVLMESLLQALAEGTHLILLGDAEQLPSVETGTILRDLVPEDDAPHVIRLTKSHRMRDDDPAGRKVLEAAQRVRLGDLLLLKDLPQRPENDLSDDGVIWLRSEAETDVASIGSFVDAWCEKHVFSRNLEPRVYQLDGGDFSEDDRADLDAELAGATRARILCVTRKFRTGAEAINDAIRRRFSQHVGGGDGLLPGMPVMMLKNDYNRRLYNGDQGMLARVENNGVESVMAVFRADGQWRAHHIHALEGVIDLSFAMTVHKAQGSEFDEVAVVLPDRDIPLLTRENLYTAITRARRAVYVYGGEELFAQGISRKVRRFSGVAQKLHRSVTE